MAEIFDVFISYRRSDGQALARNLYSYLDSKGVRVFLDEEKLMNGTYFDTQLRDKLISAPHYVLIGSTDAFIRRPGEDWVWNEMELAISEFDRSEAVEPSERTLTVIHPHDAVFPDSLPDDLNKILKVQRIAIPYGSDSFEAFATVFDTVTRVSKRNLWHSAHRWFENSKRPGGRFARLHIEESIIPKAGELTRRGELPINVSIDSSDEEEFALLDAFEYVQDHLFLIGQGGIGKTTALMKLMENAYSADSKYDKNAPIPIFVELSYAPDNDGKFYEEGKSSFIRRSVFKQVFERSFENQSLLQAVEGEKNAFTISSETAVKPINELFTKRTDSPEYLLLLDGLNEVSTSKIKNSSYSVIDLIRGEIRFLISECPNVRVILTSRSDDACGSFGELKRLYLSGVDEDSIKNYLKDREMSQAQIDAALSDEHLKDTLKIPLFLTMYAVLKNKTGICTQGEILHCFFHERRENIGVYTVQDRIAYIGENASFSANIMDNARLTVDMQNFIIDLILPEIGRYMENNGEFHISRKVLREIISKVLDGRADTDFCGICGDDAFKIGNMQGATREPSMIADEINRVFESNKNRITASIIECLVYSLGFMQMNTDESGYGFMHQHVRDFFAAMSYINAMRLAVYLYKDGEKEDALAVMNERFKDKPVGMQVRRFIGEALGEHHNAPYYDNGWKSNTPENDSLRGLIARTLNIYRGIDHDEGGYGVYSLVHILDEVRGELSGMDFSGIDFTRCSLNGMRLSRKGVAARFDNAVLSYKELGFLGHTGFLTSAAFSPDGSRIVTTSDDKTAKIWDAVSFELLGTLEGHKSSVWWAEFNHDGSRIVTASVDETAKIWDAKSFELLGTLNGHSDGVLSAAFDRNGKRIVTASWDRTARVWDADSFNLVGTLEGHEDRLHSASFNKEGNRIVTASRDKTARVWDADSFNLVGTLEGHEDWVVSASFNKEGSRIVTASKDKTAKVWDATSFQLLGTLVGHPEAVSSAAFSLGKSDSLIVTSSHDKTVKIWDAHSLKQIESLDMQAKYVEQVSFDPSGGRIVAITRSNAEIWDVYSKALIGTIKGMRGLVFFASFNQQGDWMVSSDDDTTAKIWDSHTWTFIDVLEDHKSYVQTAVVNQSNNRIVTASGDGTAKIWDAHSMALLGTLIGHSEPLCSASFSMDDNRIITTSRDKTAKIWDSHSFSLIDTIDGDMDNVYSAWFSPDNSKIITASRDKTAKIWDAESFELLGTLNGHSGGVLSAALDRNGKRIVTASMDKTAKVWDTESFELLGTLYGHADKVNSAEFNVVGNRIVTASMDKTAKIWDAESFEELGTLRGHSGSVESACYSSDDKQVATASWDGTIRIWDAETFECQHTIPNIPGLILAGVDLTRLDQRSKFSDKEKELLRIYGTKI